MLRLSGAIAAYVYRSAHIAISRRVAEAATDAHWNDFGATLVRAGRPTAIVRLAWQFNGPAVEWKDSDKARRIVIEGAPKARPRREVNRCPKD